MTIHVVALPLKHVHQFGMASCKKSLGNNCNFGRHS